VRAAPADHASAGRTGRDAQQRTDREVGAGVEPGLKLFPGPVVHADLAPATALPAAHEQRAAPRSEVGLAEREGFVDAQAGSPQHHDERAQARRMQTRAGVPHHGNDLSDGRRVGRVPLALVARPAPGVEARQRGRRSRAAGGIEKEFGHDAS
jgi:hypothetical protein